MTRLKSYTLHLVIIISSIMFLGSFLAGCGVSQNTEGKKEVKTGEQSKEEMPVPSTAPITEERTFYDFEQDLQGWEIPMWADGKSEYVAKKVSISQDAASHGTKSMMVVSEFQGNIWAAGLVEIEQYLDIKPWRVIRADIFLPAGSPEGLKAKLILTVGNNWKFVEMNRSIPLMPGQWVTITANIEPGSYDWKRVVPNEEFSEDVRKIAIRIESNRQPQYSGPVYIDNIRVGR